ncbi:MAG: hypothetical protein HKO53_00775, partial [Gemmatimonadetes bacterium]|nr:hypothetical protein [Gemmatimonadota bacterium]
FISGHTDDQLVRAGIAEGGYAFLAKPFTREDLLRKIKEILAPDSSRA